MSAEARAGVAAAALRALPGGAALDEPVLEYLAGARRGVDAPAAARTLRTRVPLP
jgi:hypothetical protein